MPNLNASFYQQRTFSKTCARTEMRGETAVQPFSEDGNLQYSISNLAMPTPTLAASVLVQS